MWPEESPSRPPCAVSLAMSPEGAASNFAPAPGGAATWLHLVSGRRTVALVPPTPANLALYAAWASSPRQAEVGGCSAARLAVE